MKNKYNRNGVIYIVLVALTIIVYLVIHLYYGNLNSEIYQCNVGRVENTMYNVKKGDSLESIAKMYNISIEKLKEANNLTSNELIPGQQLIIPVDDKTGTKQQPINNIITVDKNNEIIGLSFAQDNVSVKKGDTLKLVVLVDPVGLISTKFTWESSDPSVVSVDEDGNITGLKEGTAVITVTSPNGKTASVTITVVPNEIKIKKVILDPSKLTLIVGDSKQVSATIEPSNATNRELIWESNSPSIATVDNNGVIKAISPGTTTINVKTKDGTVVAQVIVIVKPVPVFFEYEYDEGNYIYLIDQFPIKDEIGKELQGEKHTQDFKLRFNESAEGVRYTITAEKLDGSDLKDEWTKLFLVNDGIDVDNCYRTTGRIKTFNEYTKYNGSDKEVVLYEGVVTNSEALRGYKEFTFRMWVSEDLQLNNSDYLSETKSFKTRINVYADADKD